MTEARVWAPNAERSVELVVGDRRIPLATTDGGWWAGADGVLEHGTDYAFSLDGGDARPDPRSPWQPDGPHGRSRWVDHARFEWHDQGWHPPAWPSAVVYELHVGTFTPKGTFDSAIERLDDLASLGISHIELMPVAEFPGTRGWGYDGVDLYAPEHAYGSPDGLKRFIDAAHERGLAVLLDVVYNHFGPDGNYLMQFGPYLTDRYHTLWGDAVNLDGPGSDEVRRFLIDNALLWLRDYHFDGLRLDAIHALIDRSAVHFLEQLSTEVDQLEADLGRSLVLVAESDLNDPRVVRPRDEHGYGMDAQWSDDFRHALHVSLTGEQDGIHGDFSGLEDLCTALRDVFVYAGRRSTYRRRHHGRDAGDLPRSRFVGFLQNHDQVGNRAKGERSSHLLGPDALKVAAALVVLGPQVPLLFNGEEWAASTPFLYFTDHHEELGQAVREGRRKEFEAHGWPEDEVPDPQAPETFQRSKLVWDERDGDVHAEILAWHRRLIGLRRELPGLAAGPAPDVDCDVDAGWVTVRRSGTLLAANLGDREVAVEIGSDTGWKIEAGSSDAVSLTNGRLVLPPMSATLLLESPPGA
ncbi:MAG: maltooligosyltrehalose trehalohydrolase [Chloroflexota bacterium]|jgi:maltooligosyltrehalose trehalohydrolase|nr:maltooligosyltrehalose trehalohydrolase [Chloroflexota bacterium]